MQKGRLQMVLKIFFIFLLFGLVLPLQSAELGYVTVKTQAPSNKEVKVHYRVPENFQEKPGQLYRVLVIFGGRNLPEKLPQKAEWLCRMGGRFADIHSLPGLQDDDYWYPKNGLAKRSSKPSKR
jgi:hypothetical protein